MVAFYGPEGGGIMHAYKRSDRLLGRATSGTAPSLEGLSFALLGEDLVWSSVIEIIMSINSLDVDCRL